MYLHTQQLINDIAVDEPDPAAANALQEGLGGQFGEMRTMMQYLFQAINFRGDAASKPYKDLLQGVGTEEISHVELIGTTIARLLDGSPEYSGRKTDPVDKPGAQGATPLKIALDTSNIHHYLVGAQGALPVDAAGNPWSGSYVYNSGNLVLDLLYNLMLESTGRLQKCRIYEMTDNKTARSTIAYLIVRDQAHENAFAKRLAAAERFTPQDMLAIQLDDSALFLDRWRQLLLETLTPAAASTSERRAVRDLVARTWTGRASPSSHAYALTRVFREEVSMRVMTFLLAECYEADAAFDHAAHRRREGPVWALVTGRPMHLLDPAYATWEALLLAAVDATIEQAMDRGTLDEMRWGRYNVTTYRHPLSASLPFVGRLLDMPVQTVPGDLFTPRVAWGSNAASQRMVVSPGREAEGIMQMPTGQSGHPLSPFYGSSHQAWIAGEPSPFLPGPPVYRLTLVR